MNNKILRIGLKICGFFLIANLPFFTITYLIGIDTFIESFQHPDSYCYIKDEIPIGKKIITGYIILEKRSTQGWSIGEGDQILYHTKKDNVQQRIVYQVRFNEDITTYYTVTYGTNDYDGPIYENQIIGKIIGNLQDTIWNSFCLELWKLSIENLNILALFSHT